MNIPEDPTRHLRRQGIRNSIARVRSMLLSAGRPDLSSAEIAHEARLRIERSKPGLATVRATIPLNRRDCE